MSSSTLSVLSTSSQLSRFTPRLRPTLTALSSTIGDLVTRSNHRNVAHVPYRVLLKSYVEFRSKLKKELALWDTNELVRAAEMASLLEDNTLSLQSPHAETQRDSFKSRVEAYIANLAELTNQSATGQTSVALRARGYSSFVDFADDHRRTAAIDAIVAAADCEVDAVLLTSVFPHPQWLQVRSPFGPQQVALPVSAYLTFDDAAEEATGFGRRLSLVLPDVEADLDPAAALLSSKRNAMAMRIVGAPQPSAFLGLSEGLPSPPQLSVVVSPDLKNNMDFMRFARQQAVRNSSGTTRSSKMTQMSQQGLVPFIVPFSTVHQLSQEVALGRARGGGAAAGAPFNAAASAKTLSPSAALHLSSVDIEPAEALRGVIFERLLSSARTSPMTSKSAGTDAELKGGRPQAVWAVLPPTTEFGLICGWRRNSYPHSQQRNGDSEREKSVENTQQNSPTLSSRGLGVVVGDAAARVAFIAHRVPSLLPKKGKEAKEPVRSSGHAINITSQVGLLTSMRLRPLESLVSSFGLSATGASNESGANGQVIEVGRLPTSALDLLAAGSVPSVEPLRGRGGGGLSRTAGTTKQRGDDHFGEEPTMVVDNSLSSTEVSAGKLHRHVAEKCGHLGRKLQGR